MRVCRSSYRDDLDLHGQAEEIVVLMRDQAVQGTF